MQVLQNDAQIVVSSCDALQKLLLNSSILECVLTQQQHGNKNGHHSPYKPATMLNSQEEVNAQASGACSSEWQIVLCGDIPPGEEPERYASCCALNQPVILAPETEVAVAAAQKAQVVAAQNVPRPDLDTNGNWYNSALWDPFYGTCISKAAVQMPTFYRDSNNQTQIRMSTQNVPILSPGLIARIKSSALMSTSRTMRTVRSSINSMSKAATPSSFIHPIGYTGAAELAFMQARLAQRAPLQMAASDSLLTGQGVPLKVYSGGWYFRTDCPAQNYGGPFTMQTFMADYGE